MNRFPIVRKALRAFRASGFDAYSFACWAYPRAIIDGTWKGRWVRREFRLDTNMGAWSMLEIRDEQKSDWYRRTIRAVQRAGYELRFELDNETVMRRWLHDARSRRRELEFLNALGTDANPERWPVRAKTKEPRRKRTHNTRALHAMIDEARGSPIRWSEWTLCLSHKGKLKGPTPLRVIVSVLAKESTIDATRLDVVVSVSGVASSARVPRGVTRLLRASGFRGGRPSRDGFGLKTVKTIDAALEASMHIVKHLTR